MSPLTGVYNILSTPFLPDGVLDEVSLRRLTEAVVVAGVDGITVLGVAGEAQKLTDSERRRVLDNVLEVVADRVPVYAGTSRDGTDATIAACREAADAGAVGFMVAPPLFAAPGPALTEHFHRIGEATGLPIILQDFPPTNGVTLSPADMAALAITVPEIVTIKLEDTPTPLRTEQTVTALDGANVSIVGGLGGMFLLDELRRGANGTMTGFAYPEVLVEICGAWARGDHAQAAAAYARFLPLLVFEGQPKIGLAVRKEILRRRGMIDHSLTRHPGPSLSTGIAADLDDTLSLLAAELRSFEHQLAAR